ncbi:MAG: type II secretion system inner membrane protein GspF [Pseudomonadota bacterium]
MGAYEYQALDQDGRRKKGVANGDNARQVRQQLREQGLAPIRVDAVEEQKPAETSSRPRTGGTRRKLNSMELAVITRQFSTLLGSGLTIEDCLAGLVEQADSHNIKTVLSGVRAQVLEGRSLADSLRTFPRAFPELYTASVSAGEQTGHLEEVLERLADYTEAKQGLQQRIGNALVYPVLLTLVSVAIIVGLMTYVVPQVVRVFEDTGQSLPVLTRVLITISEFLQAWGLYLLFAIVVAAILFSIMLRYPGPKYAFHKLILSIPGVRRLSRSMNTSRMARTLAILIGSGVPLLSAMRSSADVVVNRVIRRNLQVAAEEVEQVASLSRALVRRKVFPALFTQMVASGESSGRLDEMLEKSASALEREAESRISVVVSLFEPMMILIMGVVVLVIVLAILMPIFDLNQLIA